MSVTALDLDEEDAADGQLVVATPPLHGPHVLVTAGWLNALGSLEKRVSELKVADSMSAQVCADLQRRATTAGQELEKARIALKAPFLDACRKIDAAATAPEGRIASAKAVLKKALTDYTIAEAERARLAEQARLAELRRQEAIVAEERRLTQIAAQKAAEEARIAEEARLKAEADALAENEAKRAAGEAAPMMLGLDDDDETPAMEPPPPPAKSEAEIRLEQLAHAPVAVPVSPIGVSFRVTLEIKSLDVAKLPEPFVTRSANLQAIRAAYLTGWREGNAIPECPGVEFSVKKEPVSTRQRI